MMVELIHRLYTIKVNTLLDSTWQEWFDGLTLQVNQDGTSLIIGIIDDQARLHSVLNQINNLNIDLISVGCEEIVTRS